MKNRFKLLIMLSSAIFATSCEDFFDMRQTNDTTQDIYEAYPENIYGLVVTAYNAIPNSQLNGGGSTFSDCSTDNAMPSKENDNNAFKLGNMPGYWTSEISAMGDKWGTYYSAISNVNRYLAIGVGHGYRYYYGDADISLAIEQRSIGESYFLRAWCHANLLRYYAGPVADGRIMGVPLAKDVYDSDPVLSRNTYEECVDYIMADLRQVLADGYIPKEYSDNNDEPFDNIAYDTDDYGRVNTDMCYALMSRVALTAASPLFYQEPSKYDYTEAADITLEAIDAICPDRRLPDVYGLSTVNTLFYNDVDSDENILRRVNGGISGNTSIETANWPPTLGLGGNGIANPTQNLVDAFPMANGYPIDHELGEYEAQPDLYTNRDPRFYTTILYNNQNDYYTKNIELQMYVGGNTYPGYSTTIEWENTSRTGYFMNKWASPEVDIAGGVKRIHPGVALRKVELFLNFAEAACQAYGPTDQSLGYSAVDAIKEIRRRAYANAADFPKINLKYSDDYIDEVASQGAEAFMELIKNERRIELCFEDHRFFDVRRWKDDLNTPIKVIAFADADDKKGTVTESYTPQFSDYMYYMPIPKKEIQLAPQIEQNLGW